MNLDVLVVDECSMVDVALMDALLDALPRTAVLFLVGDPDQLPSVGAGRLLQDIIHTGYFTAVHLTEIHRQAAGSAIVANAHAINAGEMPSLSNRHDGDFFFLPVEEPERAADLVVDLVSRRLPQAYNLDPVRDIQVLAPMRKTICGTHALNAALQERLNPDQDGLIRFGVRYAPGDKVIQVRNDYDLEVANGEVGLITAVDVNESTVTVDYDGRRVLYTGNALENLELAYAYTIHKSQGSEAPCVVIPFLKAHWMMLSRALLYTGVTRGKRLVVLVGQQEAIRIAVQDRLVEPRVTWLKEAMERLVAGDNLAWI